MSTKSLQVDFLTKWRRDVSMFRKSHRCVGETTTTATTTTIVQRNNKINTAKFLFQKSGATAAWRQVNRKNRTCVCVYMRVLLCVCVSAWDFSSKRRGERPKYSSTNEPRQVIHRHCTRFQFRGDDIINVLRTSPSTSTHRLFSRISLIIVW
jgi:hypothetical protein